MATSDDVRRIALSLPETSEGPLYGTPGFRVKDKAFARLRDDGTVLVRLATIDAEGLRGVLVDAWRARAPRRLLAAFDASHGPADPG